MDFFKEDLRKHSAEQIEKHPGKLAAQIVFNQLIKNDFYMWFVGNCEGNQLYTVTLSNEEKAIVSFTEEYIASNYINRKNIIKQISRNFGPKVVLVNMSLYKISEIMQSNITASIQMSPHILTQQIMKAPIQTLIVNPNDRDFFIPLNIPYIMQKLDQHNDVLDFNIEEENKELCIYEIDQESKKLWLIAKWGGSILPPLSHERVLMQGEKSIGPEQSMSYYPWVSPFLFPDPSKTKGGGRHLDFIPFSKLDF